MLFGRHSSPTLGLTLYELLTLERAFNSSDRLELIERIKREEPARPRSLDSRVPRDLETIVLKAIEKEPETRYQTAEAMAEELRRFLDDEPIRARRTTTAEHFARWARRNKGLAASLLAIAMLTVAVAIGSTLAAVYFQQQEQTQKRLAARNRTLADASEAASRLAEQRADEIQQNLYCAEMNLAGQAAESAGGIGRLSELLGNWCPTAAERDRRGWEWLNWSSDGRRLACSGAGSDGTVKIWDPDTEQETATLRGHRDQLTAVSWSPDGRRLASASYDGTVRLWDADTGRELATLPINAEILWDVSWSPDGRRLACASRGGAIKVWDADNLREVAAFRCHAGETKFIRWSPDGRRLASAGLDRRVRVWHLATGRETATLGGTPTW
jgi:hypothetical protein